MTNAVATTGQHLEELLVYLDLQNQELAELCGTNIRTVYRWLAGYSPVPHAVVRFLQLAAMTRTYDRRDQPMLGWQPRVGWKHG